MIDHHPLRDEERRDFLAGLGEVIAAASILRTTIEGDAGVWHRGFVLGELTGVRRHLDQARRVLLDQARREDLAACDAALARRDGGGT